MPGHPHALNEGGLERLAESMVELFFAMLRLSWFAWHIVLWLSMGSELNSEHRSAWAAYALASDEDGDNDNGDNCDGANHDGGIGSDQPVDISRAEVGGPANGIICAHALVNEVDRTALALHNRQMDIEAVRKLSDASSLVLRGVRDILKEAS